MSDEVTIIHAADIHLDSPLRGLDGSAPPDVVQQLRRASRDALTNLVDLAIERRVGALVLAGDTYDGDSEDYQTGRFFVREMERLNDEGIPVLMVAGNHDAESVITKTLTLPDNVFAFPTDRPTAHEVPDIGTVFHGQGFKDKAVKHNLVTAYAEAAPGSFNVGILHTSLGGYSGHDTYAPCDLQQLASKGYDYFALGHIHKREGFVVDGLTAAFSGNLQGRHIRETGPKGAYVVTLRSSGPAELEFVELDVARWDLLEVDVSEAADFDAVLAAVTQAFAQAKERAGSRVLATRVRLVGTGEVAYALGDHARLRQDVQTIAEANGAVLNKALSKVQPPPRARTLRAEDRAALLAAADSPALAPASLRKAFEKLTAETDLYLRDEVQLDDEADTHPDEALSELVQAAAQDLIVRTEAGR
jgi:DNA repair exonuclease SbcCD nuclease subunit